MDLHEPQLQFPRTFGEISQWATESGISRQEARIRFAQYGVLLSIASSSRLSDLLVFKGGNALDFVWSPNRSTRDLEFSVDTRLQRERVSAEDLRTWFDSALGLGTRLTGTSFRVQRCRPNPPGQDKTFVTYDVKVGYALPDDRSTAVRIERGEPVSSVVPVEISLNEFVGGSERFELEGAGRLKVATVEDIIAEKLRAILQQIVRNRRRPQDLLDIALLLSSVNSGLIDRSQVRTFLLEKARLRSIEVSRTQYESRDVVQRLRQGYADLEPTTRAEFIEFEKAYKILIEFIEGLHLPD